MSWANFFVALGVFGMLETLFLGLACTDACRRFVITYPGFTLACMATLLALVLTLAGVSVLLLLKLRRKPAPAIEVVHAGRGRFLP